MSDQPSEPDSAAGPEIAAMSFENALAELERIVRELESGQGTLEDAIEAYDRGSRLKAHCEGKLRDAQARVESIARAADGTITAQPSGIE